MKTQTLAACLVAMLAGCGPNPDMPMYEQSGNAHSLAAVDDKRVKVTRVGVFKDDLAYGSRRGVYIIIDTDTGKEFVGVSGVGVAEMGSHSAGKSSVRDER